MDKDRAVVEAMCLAGEPASVIEDLLLCLDLSESERDNLRRIAEQGIASGDVLAMNPLTSQPQRAAPRD